jgi:tetratricopeptide (TPR) repeat protein
LTKRLGSGGPRSPAAAPRRRGAVSVAALLDEGAAHAAAGRLDEAAWAYALAERADPMDYRAPMSLATLDLRRGRPAQALPRLRRAAALRPDLYAAWRNLAAAAQALALWDEAADAYARALALRPEAADAERALAAVLTVLGRIDEAVEHWRRLAAVPQLRLEALTRLTLLRPDRAGDADLADMRRAAEDPATEPDARIGLWFALGEALERRGDDAAAFAAFAAGNRMKHNALEAGPPDTRPAAVLRDHRRAAMATIERFTPAFIAAHGGQGLATAAPIFVVGMPRSGSTLIERILGALPDVQALGETGVLPPLLEADPFAAGASRAEVRAVARRYLEGVRAHGWRGAGRFVDKTLENYLHVGWVALMFPNAVILHARRNAADTCLSCYRQLFVRSGETLYDLADIGAEYALYRQLMAHWARVLPGRVVDIDHDALAADPAPAVRRLVEACGLPWSDAALAFHEAGGAVTTASAAQVRQPIFRTSLERWRRYEAHLGPLFDALGPYAPPPRD